MRCCINCCTKILQVVQFPWESQWFFITLYLWSRDPPHFSQVLQDLRRFLLISPLVDPWPGTKVQWSAHVSNNTKTKVLVKHKFGDKHRRYTYTQYDCGSPQQDMNRDRSLFSRSMTVSPTFSSLLNRSKSYTAIFRSLSWGRKHDISNILGKKFNKLYWDLKKNHEQSLIIIKTIQKTCVFQ